MAELPDLDTTSIGHIAYWNAIDQGTLADVAPDEVLSAAAVQNSTFYDNGVEGTFQTLTGRNCTFRVKNDGWFVAWFDRTTTYQNTDGSSTEIAGRHDLANNWTGYGGNSDLTQNSLERAIHTLWNELSNSNNVQYTASDTGLYNYEFPDATTTTLLTAQHGQDSGGGNYGQSYTDGFVYTSDTTPYAVDFFFSLDRSTDSGISGESRLVAGGATVFDSANGYSTSDAAVYYGAYDLWNSNLVPNAETEYEVNHSLFSRGSYGQYARDQAGVLAVWG